MIEWFRSWHGAPTDPKWLGIARKAGVAPGVAVAVVWALMDRASQAKERGSIEGYDADGLACFFGCESQQVEAIISAMEAKGVLQDDRFSAWESRQPKYEDGAERAKAWRERNRTKPNAKNETKQTSCIDTEKKEEVDTERKKETDIRAVADATRPDGEKDFEEFWKSYPKRAGANPKTPARQKFLLALKGGVDPIDITKAAGRYADEQRQLGKVGTEHVAQAVTWLNQKRWNDYPATAPPIDGKPAYLTPPEGCSPLEVELAKVGKIHAPEVRTEIRSDGRLGQERPN